MQRDKAKVERALRHKGFAPKEGDHHYSYYVTLDGKLTTVRTKTSHGSAKYKTRGAPLISQMARQCGLDRDGFLDLVDCPLDQAAYEQQLRAQKLI